MYNSYAIRVCYAIFCSSPLNGVRAVRKRYVPLRKHAKMASSHAPAVKRDGYTVVVTFFMFFFFFDHDIHFREKNGGRHSLAIVPLLREELVLKSTHIGQSVKNPAFWTPCSLTLVLSGTGNIILDATSRHLGRKI